MTLADTGRGGYSYNYYWGGYSYTINNFLYWQVKPLYEMVYSIRVSTPPYSIQVSAYTSIRLYEYPPHLKFYSSLGTTISLAPQILN